MVEENIFLAEHRRLHARIWSRTDRPQRGVMLLIHGLGDHGGRFESFASRMTHRGWSVFAIDLPGHGRSAGRRGTARSYDEILNIIAASRRVLHDRFGDTDQVLLGHSMGGNFAVNYVIRSDEFDGWSLPPLAGLVLVAPMLMPPAFLDRPKIFAAWGTGQLLRWVRISKPARTEQLTRDIDNAQRITSDPLQHTQISLYLATQLLAQGRFALDNASLLRTPTLMLFGDEDQLIDQAACRNFTLRMRGDGQLVCWPGGRHDLINDYDAEEVAERLASWMQQRQRRMVDASRLAAAA